MTNTVQAMRTSARVEGYLRQTGAVREDGLTPAQRRRARRKARKAATGGQTALIRRERRTKPRNMPARSLVPGDVVRNLLGQTLAVHAVDPNWSPTKVQIVLTDGREIHPPKNAPFELVSRGDLDPTYSGGAR